MLIQAGPRNEAQVEAGWFFRGVRTDRYTYVWYAATGEEELYDRVLVSVGRVPNCGDLGLENTKVERDEKGFIKVNERQETTDPSILAIGTISISGCRAAESTSRGTAAGPGSR